MLEAEIFSVEDGNGLPEAAGSRRRASSGDNMQGRVGHDFAVANTMFNRISRSFDAMDGADPASAIDPNDAALEQERMMNEAATSGGDATTKGEGGVDKDDKEVIVPAPDSLTDDSTEYGDELCRAEAGNSAVVDNVSKALDDGAKEAGNAKKQRSVGFDLDSSDRSTSRRQMRRNSSVARMQRQISTFLLPESARESSKKMSRTSQRYARQSTRFLSTDVRVSVKELAETQEITEDTEHRLKGVACFFIFAFAAAILLYFMIRK